MNTAVLSTVSADGFDAIFYPGGHGPLWDLAEDINSTKLIEAFAASDRPIGAVCHAPALFKHTKGTDGKPLVLCARSRGHMRWRSRYRQRCKARPSGLDVHSYRLATHTTANHAKIVPRQSPSRSRSLGPSMAMSAT